MTVPENILYKKSTAEISQILGKCLRTAISQFNIGDCKTGTISQDFKNAFTTSLQILSKSANQLP